MRIRPLKIQDLEACPSLPEEDEIHVFILPFYKEDNMHKNIHYTSHQILCRLLSLYTGVDEKSLIFTRQKHGKPELDSDMPIHFNLSHTGNYMAFAFSSVFPVGIDIEQTNRNARIDSVAARIFLPEEAEYLKTLSPKEKQLAFFRLWTRTEAFLKGIGTGFHASFTDKKIQEVYTSWNIETFFNSETIPVPAGYVCSIAYPPPGSLLPRKT